MDNRDTDVMQLFVVLATAIFGPSVASVIGPYLLIIFAAITGAAWSLGRRESKGKLNSLFYFLRVVFIAVLLTVAIARSMVSYMPNMEMEWLISPVALLIGLIGDDWNKIFVWCMNVVKRFADKWLNKKLGE